MIRPLLFQLILLMVFSAPVRAHRNATPVRIVTLAPVISEWTAEILGPEYSRDRMIGVSEYSHYPAFLKTKPSIGPYPQPNLEAILALQPDLVIGSEEYTRADQIERMRRLKLPLQVLPKERFSSMESWIATLGTLLGEEKRAVHAAEKWRRAKRGLRRGSGAFRRAFIEIQHEPLITAGAGSFLAEALRESGYDSIFSDLPDGYPKVTLESVVKRNPEWILILKHDAEATADFKRARAAWEQLGGVSAVKHRRILALPGDDFARCSLRLLNALKQLNSRYAD